MRRTPERSVARAVLDALTRLPVSVEDVTCAAGAAAVPSYPGGTRPTSTVVLRGGGEEGCGENVAWTADAHAGFAERATRMAPYGRRQLDAWARELAGAVPDPYERAALESAAIDLALRQHGTSLLTLTGVAPGPVRYVVSFERVADPVERARQETPGIELKIDVDPAWSDATYAALAALGRVAILDFKAAGTVTDHERAHRALPEAVLEDPLPGSPGWSASLRRRLSFDAAITSAVALASLPVRPAAVNLKPARMGGLLEALRCAAACAAEGIDVYIGGMFEVGVGRLQLRALAALLCPDAPNDIAPIGRAGELPARPARLAVDAAAMGLAREGQS